MGTAKDVEIWTDHQNLQYFRLPQKLNRRQACWVTELAEYYFILQHNPGILNKKADLLSRCDDHNQRKGDNDDIVVLQPAHFRALVMPMTNSVLRQVEEITRREELWDVGIATSLAHDRGISKKDGLLHYDRRVYVLRKTSL